MIQNRLVLVLMTERRHISIYFGDNLVSWMSSKYKVVAKSSVEGEYKSISLAASEVI